MINWTSILQDVISITVSGIIILIVFSILWTWIIKNQ